MSYETLGYPPPVGTTEALMTDPTTEEGRAYWQQRHDYEAALERQEQRCQPCQDEDHNRCSRLELEFNCCCEGPRSP